MGVGLGRGIAWLTGSQYTAKDAAFDAASGALCGIGHLTKLKHVRKVGQALRLGSGGRVVAQEAAEASASMAIEAARAQTNGDDVSFGGLLAAELGGSALGQLARRTNVSPSGIIADGQRFLDDVPMPPAVVARTWQQYEKGVRDLYGEMPFAQRQYTAIVDGEVVNGVADNVALIGGRNVAIEAKFVSGDWSNSLRNPRSGIGGAPFSREERRKLVSQAKKYVAAFDEVVYHSNSEEFIEHYTTVFRRLGIENVSFVYTPSVRQ